MSPEITDPIAETLAAENRREAERIQADTLAINRIEQAFDIAILFMRKGWDQQAGVSFALRILDDTSGPLDTQLKMLIQRNNKRIAQSSCAGGCGQKAIDGKRTCGEVRCEITTP